MNSTTSCTENLMKFIYNPLILLQLSHCTIFASLQKCTKYYSQMHKDQSSLRMRIHKCISQLTLRKFHFIKMQLGICSEIQTIKTRPFNQKRRNVRQTVIIITYFHKSFWSVKIKKGVSYKVEQLEENETWSRSHVSARKLKQFIERLSFSDIFCFCIYGDSAFSFQLQLIPLILAAPRQNGNV